MGRSERYLIAESTAPMDFREELEFCEQGLTLDGWLTLGYNRELLQLISFQKREECGGFYEFYFQQLSDCYLEEEQHIAVINTFDEQPFFLTVLADEGQVSLFLPGDKTDTYDFKAGAIVRLTMSKYDPVTEDFLYFTSDSDEGVSPRFVLRYNSFVIEPEIGKGEIVIVRVSGLLSDDQGIPHFLFSRPESEWDQS